MRRGGGAVEVLQKAIHFVDERFEPLYNIFIIASINPYFDVVDGDRFVVLCFNGQ